MHFKICNGSLWPSDPISHRNNEVRQVNEGAIWRTERGICRVFIPHTTAGITINENADRSVMKDVTNYLSKLIPIGGSLGYSFKHMEGNSDAHIKCSLTGT